MSDKKTDPDLTTLDNSMPTPSVDNPVIKKPVAKPLDNSMPSEPTTTEADTTITTLDNSMPAPPALDLDSGK